MLHYKSDRMRGSNLQYEIIMFSLVGMNEMTWNGMQWKLNYKMDENLNFVFLPPFLSSYARTQSRHIDKKCRIIPVLFPNSIIKVCTHSKISQNIPSHLHCFLLVIFISFHSVPFSSTKHNNTINNDHFEVVVLRLISFVSDDLFLL